ncbi:MAG: triose-phosphate isomerase [Candidatus Aminicenantes bacterium]|nr:MAG: triose-phosphate isomerase [Candidatus Aminicenantes bacterium]
MRTPIIAGNWKMNLTLSQAIELVDGIHYGLLFPGETDVVVAPPFLCLPGVAGHLEDSYIGIAAQNLHFEDQGAFTGECSGKQIKDAGADYVIVGHSERRQYFGETDEIVNKKIKAAFRNDLVPIVCVGETLAERERGEVAPVIGRQLAVGLLDLAAEEISRLIIAYEPVWAIGTGKTATPEQVEEVHRLIRFSLSMKFGGQTGEVVRILYGGSVKPSNSKELLALPNVDGALVGGASLKAPDFIEIIKNVKV